MSSASVTPVVRGTLPLRGGCFPGTSLARLHGYGFEVDIAAVRAIDLHEEDDDDDDDDDGDNEKEARRVIALTAQLHDCFTGEGEPPLELLLATVACAASGEVWGIPIRELREGDVVGDLDLSRRRIGPSGVQLLCLLPGTACVLTLKYVNAAHPLTFTQNPLTLLQPDNSLEENYVGSEGAKHLSEALKVNTTITDLKYATG